MANLRSIQVVLQEQIAPNDVAWNYAAPNLPKPKTTDTAGLIKSVSFVSSLTQQYVKLRLENCPQNRITRNEPLNSLLLLSFADFRLREARGSGDGRVVLAPARDSAEYIARVLKTGITLGGRRYHFFGHSNSQLKSRSCFMYAAPKGDISDKIEALGDFSKMKSVGKKVKRIGLLFSSAELATTLDTQRCEDIDDIANKDYIFTDGCGLVSTQLANLIVQRRNIVFRNQRYHPSVFQIRYRGYKGVLTLCPALKGEKQVQFRESMRKFKDVKDLSFSVVEYSKPYQFGHLNDEIVLLLSTLGITTEILLRKQAEYLQFLEQASSGAPRAAFQYLSYQSEIKLAEKLLIEGAEAVQAPLRSSVRQEYTKMLNKYEEQRCRIMIPQSRLLFGVCDPTGKAGSPGRLKTGTCFVRITLDGDGQARTLINTEVLVTRNPCLHPGDLQKFRTVDIPELSHLVDCIVFPTNGPRPSADMMSGGDLDGDKFFVTWDPEIIPRTLSHPATYPGVKEKIEFSAISDDDRAEFFAKYSNASLGRVKNLYLKWARLNGAMSAECQELNRLFSQCVDGNRISVPKKLEDPPEPAEGTAAFALDVLHEAATAMISAAFHRDEDLNYHPKDTLDLLASRGSIAVSEFQLIQMVLKRCSRADDCDFHEYAPFFNYAALNDEQKAWLLDELPISKDMPSMIRNGLLQSELVLPEELRTFDLHLPNLHWKPVFSSTTDRMGRFLSCASRSLELFHKKLIVIQPDERLTLMIYVPQKVESASEAKVDSSVRVFALPRSSGCDSVKYRVMPTKENYRLYCDNNVFQLYQTQRRDTFIFLTRGEFDKSSYGHTQNKGDMRKQKQVTIDDGTNFDCRASVALNKIHASIQRHVGRMNRAGVRAAEIYVISNRDVESMRYLDEWLQFVGTDQIMPLFSDVVQEYRVTSFHDLNRNELLPAVAGVALDNNLAALQAMADPSEIKEVLHLLVNASRRTQLRAVYNELINLDLSNNTHFDRLSILRELLDFLPMAAFLTKALLESQLWKTYRDNVVVETESTLPIVLRELVLEANRLQAFVRQPFVLVLKELKEISFQTLGDLVELIALGVEEPEFALDLLIECLEPETSKLLVGRPLEIQQYTSNLIGIAMDHIDEAKSVQKFSKQTLSLQRAGTRDGFEVVKVSLRIDAIEGRPKIGDHIRFVASAPPQNAPLEQPYQMDALVTNSEQGSASFRCVHHPPSFLEDCSWRYKHCGSFITSKAMFDAVTKFYASKEAACGLYKQLAGLPSDLEECSNEVQSVEPDTSLNPSQNQALAAAIQSPFALLWGPPGTGKTHTIVVILKRMLQLFDKSRFLVTAPTHNAVDNILQRFVNESGPDWQGERR